MTSPGQARAHARRRHDQQQLALDRKPSPAAAHECFVCLGHGGWHVPTTEDGNPLPPPGQWIECWACDPDEQAA